MVERFEAGKSFDYQVDGFNVSFRRVCESDFDEFCRENEFTRAIEPPRINERDWICEVIHEGPKDTYEAINRGSDIAEDVLLAIALTQNGRCIFQLLTNEPSSRFVKMGRTFGGRFKASSPIGGNNVILAETDISTLEINYRMVKQVHRDGKYKWLRLPLRRLRLSSGRAEPEDQLVDYVIGMEGLLANDTDNLEATFRFRLRGAAVLPEEFGTARERIRMMNDLYRVRSRVVHGSADQDEVKEKVPEAEKALKAVILWYWRAINELGSFDTVKENLDAAIVSGGFEFAREIESEWATRDPR